MCTEPTKVAVRRINGYLTGKRHWVSERLTDIKTREPLDFVTQEYANFLREKHHQEIENAAKQWKV